MRRNLSVWILGVALGAALAMPVAGLAGSHTEAKAAAAKGDGVIVAVETAVVKVKGSDGKTYEIVAEKIVGLDLKTGDAIEYDIVGEKPVNVKKKAK